MHHPSVVDTHVASTGALYACAGAILISMQFSRMIPKVRHVFQKPVETADFGNPSQQALTHLTLSLTYPS